MPNPLAGRNLLNRRNLLRFALLAALASAGYLIVVLTPFGDFFSRSFLTSHFDAIRLRWWSPFVFIALYAAACALATPAAVWTFVGGAVFSVFPGLLYNVAGSNLGASLSFGLARSVSPVSLAATLRKTRLAPLGRRLEKGTVGAIFMMRLLLIFPFNVTNLLAGISGIRYRDYAVGSFAGMLPVTIFYTYLGDGIMSRLRRGRGFGPQDLWVLALLIAGMGLYAWVFARNAARGKPA